MGVYLDAAYRLDPALWVDRVLRPKLGLDLDAWQRTVLRAPRGSRVVSLVYRQAGKSTTAALAASHTMIYRPGTTSLALAPTQRQSAEIIRKARACLLAAGVKPSIDNAFSLEADGSRLVALPGSDDASIRGLSIDGELIVDEAARVDGTLYAAVRPMIARHADKARLILASTAWLSSGFFHGAWTDTSGDWLKIEAKTADTGRISEKFLAAERRALGERAYFREYENVFDSDDASVFTLEQIDDAFGGVQAPTPPLGNELDPVLDRRSAFQRDPFAPARTPFGQGVQPGELR